MLLHHTKTRPTQAYSTNGVVYPYIGMIVYRDLINVLFTVME